MTRNATQQPTLAEFIADARAAAKGGTGMSYREVAAASGGVVTSSSVHKLETGQRASTSPKNLAALAKALGVPVESIRAAARQTVRVPRDPFVLPERASGLTAKQRRLVLAVVDGLLEAGRS